MRNQQSDKKREERDALDMLIRLYPGVPKGKIYISESPDFIIRMGPRVKTGIEITRFTKSKFNASASDDHFFPVLSKNELEELISAKEEKLTYYHQQKLRQIWLVIIVSGFSHSPAYNVHNQIERWNIHSGYDRILILDQSREIVYHVSGN